MSMHRVTLPVWLAFLVVCGLLTGCGDGSNDSSEEWVRSSDQPVTVPDASATQYVTGVTVDSADELMALLRRAEQLAGQPRAKENPPQITLVLHGPEVTFFNIRNYDRYQDVVDLAARLDAFNVIDIKMCQTAMGMVGLEREDIPAFIELVPFGPDEVDRLLREGAVTL